MSCSFNSSKCDCLLRSASNPPWTAGCNVFTRPSIISGKFVNSDTLFTATFASCKAFNVPPVLNNSYPLSTSFCPNSVIPVLSETLSNALIRLPPTLFSTHEYIIHILSREFYLQKFLTYHHLQ